MKKESRLKPSKYYITTAIDYVNASPHIGHAYEKVCADALARWHRFRGDDVYFLTGTDENAQKNIQAADEAGLSIEEFIEKNTLDFIKLCDKLNLSNDDFIRTTQKRHTEVTQKIFNRLHEKGDIYKDYYEGYYCQGCEAFITEKELIDGKCPEHHTEPELIKEESYFFKLSRYQDKIISLIKAGLVEPETRKNEMLSRLKEHLSDLSVSRKGISWGVPVPFDKEHRVYVWVDALINYVSALGYPDDDKFKRYWPADVHLIGKGINWFHSVIWPAILISADIEVPRKVFVHGYLTIDGKKISKSLGNAINPVPLADKYGVDPLRYFLLRDIPFGQDGDFSHDAFIHRYNSDLANDIGNLLNRTLTMVEKYYGGVVPDAGESGELDDALRQAALELAERADEAIGQYKINYCLEIIWGFINLANKYIEDSRPWQLAKNGPDKLKTVIYSLAESLRIIALAVKSFLPETALGMWQQLGIKEAIENKTIDEIKSWGLLAPGTKVAKGQPLFPRIIEE